jgi:alcohol dehydrogenase
MKSFRLAGFTGLENLELGDDPDQKPVRGEVLIRVRAVALNFRDLAMATGRYPVPHRAGLVPVSDAAGDVVDVGEGVTSFSVGDRVINSFHPRWFGGLAPAHQSQDQYGSSQDGWLTEYKAVSQEAILRFPEHLSYAEASTLPCAALTAWTALHSGARPIGPGQAVLTQGTGGVSLFAVQLAKLAGAQVIATTSGEHKAQILRELGADHVINYNEFPDWGVRARQVSGKEGVDQVIEVGGAGTLVQSMKSIRPGGEVALIGFLDSYGESSIDFFEIFASGATFRVINVGHRSGLSGLLDAVDRGSLKPVIDNIYPFADAVEAYRRMASGIAVGKIVISL